LKILKKIPLKLNENFPIETQIMLMLVDNDPNKRPSAEDLMKHDLYLEWELEVSRKTETQR